MKKYFDPIYGHVELKPIIWEILTKCAELKRLRFIGMMNFKSLSMLPLTTITRLEHTIGLSYLTQLFVDNNTSLKNIENDLLVASLYHDVNCGSFGHAVEWAIDRHVEFKHEQDTSWVQAEDTLDQLKNKPIFLEQDGLHQFNFGPRYSLNFKSINALINGSDYYFINNSGIDLDNIDNVFRMAHYFGFDVDKKTPSDLAISLKYNKDFDNFLIDHKKSYLIKDWLETRSSVYEKFIYSEEYMAYEYLIYKLVSSYSSTLEKESEVKNLFHFTDERLLWTLYENKSSNADISKTAKKLLLHDLPSCFGILKSKHYDSKSKFDNIDYFSTLESKINSRLKNIGVSTSVFIHMTTDNRKTNRKVDFYSIEQDQNVVKQTIGEDKQYILLAILGNQTIDQLSKNKILCESIKVLDEEGFKDFETTNDQSGNSLQLSLF